MELFKSKELKNEFEEMKKLLPSIIDCNYSERKMYLSFKIYCFVYSL